MIKNLYSFFIFLLTSVSSISLFLPEKVNAFPIYAQQAYENPREANGRIVCANCHLAQKPTQYENPQAVLPDTVFEAVVTIGQMAGVKDMKITLRNKDTEDLQFKSDMRNAKFIRSIVQRTEKDFESIAEQEDKKEEPKGLMARPEPVDIKNQVKEEDMEDEE